MGKARRDIPIKGFTYRKTGRNNIAPPTLRYFKYLTYDFDKQNNIPNIKIGILPNKQAYHQCSIKKTLNLYRHRLIIIKKINGLHILIEIL